MEHRSAKIRFDGYALHYRYVSLIVHMLSNSAAQAYGYSRFYFLHSRQQEKRRYDTNGKAFSVTREGNLVTMKVEAGRILYNMVRIMVGTF